MLIGGVRLHSADWLGSIKRVPFVSTGRHHAKFDFNALTERLADTGLG